MKYIKLFENIFNIDNIKIKIKKHNEDSNSILFIIKIYNEKKNILGYVDLYYYKKTFTLSFESIIIKNEFRNKGLGNIILTKIKLSMMKKYKISKIIADVLSKQSFKSFIKAFGIPDFMIDSFKNYNNIEDALNNLPNYTNVNETDMEIIGGTSDALHIEFNI